MRIIIDGDLINILQDIYSLDKKYRFIDNSFFKYKYGFSYRKIYRYINYLTFLKILIKNQGVYFINRDILKNKLFYIYKLLE